MCAEKYVTGGTPHKATQDNESQLAATHNVDLMCINLSCSGELYTPPQVTSKNRLCSDPDPYPGSHVHSDPDPALDPNRIRIISDPDAFKIFYFLRI